MKGIFKMFPSKKMILLACSLFINAASTGYGAVAFKETEDAEKASTKLVTGSSTPDPEPKPVPVNPQPNPDNPLEKLGTSLSIVSKNMNDLKKNLGQLSGSGGLAGALEKLKELANPTLTTHGGTPPPPPPPPPSLPRPNESKIPQPSIPTTPPPPPHPNFTNPAVKPPSQHESNPSVTDKALRTKRAGLKKVDR